MWLAVDIVAEKIGFTVNAPVAAVKAAPEIAVATLASPESSVIISTEAADFAEADKAAGTAAVDRIVADTVAVGRVAAADMAANTAVVAVDKAAADFAVDFAAAERKPQAAVDFRRTVAAD